MHWFFVKTIESFRGTGNVAWIFTAMTSKESVLEKLAVFADQLLEATADAESRTYIQSHLDALQLRIQDDKYANVQPLMQLLTTAGGHVESLSSCDPVQVSCALLATMSWSGVPGDHITSIFISLLAAVLTPQDQGNPDCFSQESKDASMGFGVNAVLRSVKTAFRNADDITSEVVDGMATLFAASLQIQNSATQEILRMPVARDVAVEDSIGEAGLAHLRTFILESQSTDSLEGATQLLSQVQAYCQLVLLRLLVLQQKAACLALLNKPEVTTTDRIKAELAITNHGFLDFLRVASSVERRLVTALYSADSWPVIEGFLQLVKLPGPLTLQPGQRVLITEAGQLCVSSLRTTASDVHGYYHISDASSELTFKIGDACYRYHFIM